MKYKYEANLQPTNTANQIILDVDAAGTPTRILHLGGEGELTYTQFLRLKDLFVLTPVKENEPDTVEKEKNTTEVVKSENISVAKVTDRP